MFLNILVAYDGSRSARRAWEQAIDLARSQNSKLTVITVAPPVPPFAAFAGVSIERMKEELETWAARMNREAADAAPDGVVVHTVQRSGHAGEEIVKEIDRGAYDLVVLGSRGHGQVGSSVLGSVNGYVHFHSKVALLSIDDPEHQGSARPGSPSHG